ncbi:SAM-dependent methyltransferase [Silvanigrella paludirubra]|uniref:SAM-dependent methyltransferase n=1 Tax=Silvanigrella paludirubra TaxID=2499159 RepID=A0A6N6VNU8_9BACT|nr:class I SAM-dependent methyltransferase [Silvanigrella paludirubra]KAB8036863.1 SAM-dependent methyltransferase [Silvanigrella paludirubra]
MFEFNLEDFNSSKINEVIHFINNKTKELGFDMASRPETGALLRVLAASKPNGRFLEIGTGTGLGTAWLLEGMDKNSKLISIECDKNVQSVAKEAFLNDDRLELIYDNGSDFLKNQIPNSYDMIFADAYPGKYEFLDETLNLLKPGGIYIVDDMLPQADWPEDHFPLAKGVLDSLKNLKNVVSVGLNWSSGLIIIVPKRN